jgi:hypothetical protein
MVDEQFDRILEGLDACRPGSDDLARLAQDHPEIAARLAEHPQLARWQRRVEAIDRQIADAMHAVPVPDGLAARLLAKLPIERSSPSSAPVHVSRVSGRSSSTEGVSISDRTDLLLRIRYSRRAWALGGALALAASLLVAASLGLFGSAPQPLFVENLESTALAWYGDLDLAWQTSTPPASHPVSQRVLPTPQGWQRFDASSDRSSVAYDLTPRGAAHRVTLLVARVSVPTLAGSPPSRPPVATLGRLIATWQEGEFLYVLVIEGTESLDALYRRYVDTKTGPIA